MDTETIRKVILNLRSPINVKQRVHFTTRTILFIEQLFDGKRIDTIELHYILLQLAYVSGCFIEEKKYVTLKTLVVYLCEKLPPCISVSDIKNIGSKFTEEKDSEFCEVQDMKIILHALEISE